MPSPPRPALALAALALVACGAPPALPSAPTIALSADELAFALPTDGASYPAPQSVVVRNAGTGALAVPLPSVVLAAYPAPAGAPDGWLQAAVIADPEGYRLIVQPTVQSGNCHLPAGNYVATVLLEVPNAANSPRAVQVTLTVPLPVLAPLPATVGFLAPLDGSDPPGQTLQLRNLGGYSEPAVQALDGSSDVLSFRAERVAGSFGEWRVGIAVSLSTVAFLPGRFEWLAVAHFPEDPRSASLFRVALDVPPAHLRAEPGSLHFSVVSGAPTAQRTVFLHNDGRMVGWDIPRIDPATPMPSWLSASLAIPFQAYVTVDASGLAPGTYGGTLAIKLETADNSPLSLPVVLDVFAPTPVLSGPALDFRAPPSGDPAPVRLIATEAHGGPMGPPTVTVGYLDGAGWLEVAVDPRGPSYGIIFQSRVQGLPPGRYDATIGVSAPGGATVTTGASLLVEDWVPTSPLDRARSDFGCLVLPDGRVWIGGGKTVGESVVSLPGQPVYYDQSDGSTAVYDPASDTWAVGPSLTVARHSHSVTLLRDGSILVAGGIDQGGDPSLFGWVYVAAGYELHRPGAGWSGGGPLQVPRYGHGAILLRDGRVLIFGGADDASAEIVDPALPDSSPTGSMLEARHFPRAVLLPSSRKVLVAGGSALGSSLTSAEIFDPDTGTWSATGAMGSPGAILMAPPGGPVLAIGSSAVESYEPASGTWTALRAPPLTVRQAVLLPGGKVFAVGVGGAGELAAAVYDPARDTWSGLTAPHADRGGPRLAPLPGGGVLLAGSEGPLATTAEVFRGALP